MTNLNEEEYLDKLLKTVNEIEEEEEESDEEMQERLIKEQIKDAVEKSNSQSKDDIVEYYENDTPEVIKKSTKQSSDETKTTQVLGEEYKKIFEPEDSDFNISDIPDREPEKLTQSEIDRLANMNLDSLLDDVVKDSINVDELFKTNIDKSKATDNINISENNILSNVSNELAASMEEELKTNETVEAQLSDSATKSISKSHKDKLGKNKKTKENKSFDLFKFIKNIFLEELQPIKDENTHLNNSLKTVDSEDLDEPLDENELVLKELYGSKTNGENDDYSNQIDSSKENEIDKPVKKGILSIIKDRFSNFKDSVDTELEEEDEDEDELEKKLAKATRDEAKKAANQIKKQAKIEKIAEAKAKKILKKNDPKKAKKPKPLIKPQDKLKVKPKSLVLILLFISGFVILTYIFNDVFYYNYDTRNARAYYQTGSYELAYKSLQGTKLKPADEKLYEQVTTIMYVQKQLTSYENYVKLGMGFEALDSLIKGIQRYYTFYQSAKEIGVSEQLDGIKVQLVDALKTKFSISEAKAVGYAALSEENFIQYNYTLESYGGMIRNDSNN